MTYDFQTFYVTSWGWHGNDRLWRVYLDSDDLNKDDIYCGEFYIDGAGRGLPLDVAVDKAQELINARMS